MLLPLLLALAQSDRLPPADPLPLADPYTAAVMVPIRAMLAGIGAGDGAAATAQVRAEGGATAVAENADGTRAVRHLSWPEFAARFQPGGDRSEERLGEPAIEIDGDIAMVWAPYAFLVGGKLHHCGFDHFDLVREAGRWKVLNVTWSQRTTGCPAP